MSATARATAQTNTVMSGQNAMIATTKIAPMRSQSCRSSLINEVPIVVHYGEQE